MRSITPRSTRPLFTSAPFTRAIAAAVAALALLSASSDATCTGDLDGSGSVDGTDLASLLGAWGTGDASADIDSNGVVDGADLSALLGAWGACPAAPEDWTLYTLLSGNTTIARNSTQQVMQTWTGSANGASVGYLRPDGSLVRPCVHTAGAYTGGGRGGRIQIFSATGSLINDLYVSTAAFQQHHDVRPLPNGNILCIAWEGHTQAEGTAAGRSNLTTAIWPETILEIQPTGFGTYNTVWRWSLWNHLIQDVNPSLANYGIVADHPELMNINYGTINQSDWIHANAIDYDEGRDQILLSSRSINEVWVIDHSTTTAQAATHAGGNSSRGGDLLYRWGNPQAYGRGTAANQVFFVVHSATWIDAGMTGAGNILAFNNGDRAGMANDYSTVVEIVPPRDAAGNYVIGAGMAFGPSSALWSYGSPGQMYGGQTQCGAFRTRDNTTLITLTNSDSVFEVNQAGSTLWSITTTGMVARAPRYRLINGQWVGP